MVCYSYCKDTLSKLFLITAAAEKGDGMQRTLKLTRAEHKFVATLKGNEIYLDGVRVAKVRNGEEKTFQIDEKEHEVRISASGNINDVVLTIPAGHGNLSLTYDFRNVGLFGSEWYFPGIHSHDVPNPLDEYRQLERYIVEAKERKESETEAFVLKITNLASRVINEGDEDALQELEDLKEEVQQKISSEAPKDPGYYALGVNYYFALSKFYMVDTEDTTEAAEYIALALQNYDAQVKTTGPMDGEEFMYNELVNYDAYIQYCNGEYVKAIEKVSSQVATVANLALICLSHLEIDLAIQGDLFSDYNALSHWDEEFRKTTFQLTACWEQDLFRMAYGRLMSLVLDYHDADPRIPSDKYTVYSLITRMEQFKARMTDEEEIALVDKYIGWCNNYLASLG